MHAKWVWALLAMLGGACGGDDESAGSGGGPGGSGAAGGSGGTGASTGAGGSGGTGTGAGAGGGGVGAGGFGGSGEGYALRFYGNGIDDIDRVKIRIDDETTTAAGPPHDVGSTDFTIELWIRGNASDNGAGPIGCGGYNWINGNIVVDRDRFNQGRAFGLSIGGGLLNFGVINQGSATETICGTTDVLDGAWHHVAIARRRSDGYLWIWLDGTLEASGDGPDGDLSYPDDGVPGSFCGGPCDFSDPFLVIGAEKHDAGSAYPSFSGLVDELRISTVLRYEAAFTPSSSPFTTDADTAGLYHFDEGQGAVGGDAASNPVDADLRIGGDPEGPEWTTTTPF